jgi:hypothetical protein
MAGHQVLKFCGHYVAPIFFIFGHTSKGLKIQPDVTLFSQAFYHKTPLPKLDAMLKRLLRILLLDKSKIIDIITYRQSSI